MRVLLLETEAGAADDTAQRLLARGHEIVRCHEQLDRRAFPSVGLVDGARCPMEGAGAGVDVALTVRRTASPLPAPLEDGIACALHAHVPVVVAGAADSNPYDPLGAVVAGDDVVRACEDAAFAPLERHGAVALDALNASLAAHDVPHAGACATVRRSRDGLRVVLSGPAIVDDRTVALATSRVVGALRAFDHHAPKIDVAFERA
jgi:hypothetical protein